MLPAEANGKKSIRHRLIGAFTFQGVSLAKAGSRYFWTTRAS